MQMTLTSSSVIPVVKIQVTLEPSPNMVLALFIGFLVTEQKVPEEIQKALDLIKEEDAPYGWSMFIGAWQNRSDDAVQDVYEILGQMIKDAVKT